LANERRDRVQILEDVVGKPVDRAVASYAERVAIGIARTTRPTPTLPSAPGHILDNDRSAKRIRSATMHATASFGPSAANGTIIVMGRDG
jgi:hypothetical protein